MSQSASYTLLKIIPEYKIKISRIRPLCDPDINNLIVYFQVFFTVHATQHHTSQIYTVNAVQYRDNSLRKNSF